MATWHPPIPAKKLYSKEALDLGAGLALLIWCYDGIERDGHIDIELNKLTAEFGVSYRTIKDWWAALRDGPFFKKKEDRGRKGWRVWLADEWIDWHIMANNYPAQGQKTTPEDSAQGPLKARSRPAQGQNIALETSAYKEDHHDPTPTGGGGDFVKTLIRDWRIGSKRAREIAATGADPETVYQSLRNCVNPKDPHSLGRLILDLVDAPPETGKPYPGPFGKPAQNGTGPPGWRPPADALSPDEARAVIARKLEERSR